jgi:hypothetical protein
MSKSAEKPVRGSDAKDSGTIAGLRACLQLAVERAGTALMQGCADGRNPSAAFVFQNALEVTYRELVRFVAGQRPGKPAATADAGLRAAAKSAVQILRHSTADTPWPEAAASALWLGELHQAMLGLRPRIDSRRQRFELQTGASRRRSGSFYTPPALIELMLDKVLEPALDRRLQRCSSLASQKQALLSYRVLDPACGSGNILANAAHRLALRLAKLSGSSAAPARQELLRHLSAVCRACIYGTDSDGLAVFLCRAGLWLDCGSPGKIDDWMPGMIQQGDSLLVSAPKGRLRSFKAVVKPASYDLVIANPPFRSIIAHQQSDGQRVRLARIQPQIGGTADLASRFLVRGLELANDNGDVVMVQPRSTLISPALSDFRQHPPRNFRPTLVYVAPESNLFSGAAVFIALLGMSQRSACRVGMPGVGNKTCWHTGTIKGDNWWTEAMIIAGSPPGIPKGEIKLGNIFKVQAGMTAGEAYEVAPWVVDQCSGRLPKLLTTGLIDPGKSLWGSRMCRYLHRDYRHPRVDDAARFSTLLTTRLQLRSRPKLLVAGLARRIECYFDRRGEYLGAVSTWTILHEQDDTRRLEQLADLLDSPEASMYFQLMLGASALGGGNITMRKSFLRDFPLPGRLFG